MDEKETPQFSWTAFFLVTGFSFFMFSKLMNFLDGTQLPVFTWIGIVAIVTGLVTMVTTLKQTSGEK